MNPTVAVGRYLLDTNIAIAILEGELDLGSRLYEEVEMFPCVPVVGELCFGAEKSSLQ
ncbi:MAG: hypothetical protein IH936_09615 [Acidobacteria bacterium]|nr:hypothetical protein [Acidobacteriota bacterium]